MTARRRRTITAGIAVLLLFAAATGLFVKANPLIFNESFFSHAHCITTAATTLAMFAEENSGRFPYSTNGYGDALLIVATNGSPACFTGPGHDARVFEEALTAQSNVSEARCGRVYVQGLRRTDNPKIALLYDKQPTPGGDHCHLLKRVFAPLGREVAFIDGSHHFIPESEWKVFAQNQVKLLTQSGMSEVDAKQLYSPATN